jgi:hypothetical protein
MTSGMTLSPPLLPPVAHPDDIDALPVPRSVTVERPRGLRLWTWWGPATSRISEPRPPTGFIPAGTSLVIVRPSGAKPFREPEQDCLVWSSGPITKHRTRSELFFGRPGRSQGRIRLLPADGEMLSRFVALVDASPSVVREFALRYGVLGICSHGKPCTHTPFTSERSLSGVAPERCTPIAWDGTSGVEPIAAWHAYARLAATILRVAGKLQSGVTPEPEELAILHGARARLVRAALSRRVNPSRAARLMARPSLVAAINRWIVDGDVRPYMLAIDDSRHQRMHVRLTSPWWLHSPSWPLFGALGVALAQKVATANFVRCAGCGDHFTPSRMPRAGENNYCETCRKAGFPLRDAKRAQRARERANATALHRPAGPTRPALRPRRRRGAQS